MPKNSTTTRPKVRYMLSALNKKYFMLLTSLSRFKFSIKHVFLQYSRIGSASICKWLLKYHQIITINFFHKIVIFFLIFAAMERKLRRCLDTSTL